MKLVGVYFALDDVDGVGFDQGVWKGQFDPSDGMVTLDDETYRAVIKTKILANKFDGKNESVPEFLNTALGYFGVPAKLFDFQDQQNMHVVINLTPRSRASIRVTSSRLKTKHSFISSASQIAGLFYWV